jgi:penicillin-binding protein 2
MADRDDAIRDGERRFTRRSLLLGSAQAAGFSLIGWRLFDLQVLERGHYAPLAEENRINLQILVPRRGRILDDTGRPLADNEQIFRATVTPALTNDVHAVLARLQQILPLTDDAVAEIIRRTKKQSRSTPTIISSELTFDELAKLNLFAPSLPGIATEEAWRRRYHGGDSIGHVVGFVGSVDRFGVDDDAILRLPDMRIGKSGAEAGFEGILRGSGGTRKIEVDARGRMVRTLETVEPVHGRDVTLSSDADLQQAVLSRMQRERTAAAIIVDVNTGEIVSLVSVPGFDPARIAAGISETDWRKLTTAEDKPLLNRVVSGQYVPGSTFTIVTALAALDAGVVAPDERISCPGHYKLGKETYPCWNPAGHGDLTIHEALHCACDVFFYEIARRAGIEKIATTARRLGLGAIYDFGLTEEKAGVIPDRDWKRGNLNAPWLGGETLLTGIGQGYVQTTPLQLALMTARVAGGREILPSIEKKTRTPSRIFEALPFQTAHLDIVRNGMRAAVNEEGGTADNAKLGPGRPVVAGQAETGTLDPRKTAIQGNERQRAKRDPAIVIAYTPFDAPRYAIATVIEHAGASDSAAAPLARDILNLVLDHDLGSRAHKSGTDDGAVPAGTGETRTTETAG